MVSFGSTTLRMMANQLTNQSVRSTEAAAYFWDFLDHFWRPGSPKCRVEGVDGQFSVFGVSTSPRGDWKARDWQNGSKEFKEEIEPSMKVRRLF